MKLLKQPIEPRRNKPSVSPEIQLPQQPSKVASRDPDQARKTAAGAAALQTLLSIDPI
jgi:hypothetical protein